MGADEPAHIFDDTDHGDVELPGEHDGFAGVENRYVLGVVTITAPFTFGMS